MQGSRDTLQRRRRECAPKRARAAPSRYSHRYGGHRASDRGSPRGVLCPKRAAMNWQCRGLGSCTARPKSRWISHLKPSALFKTCFNAPPRRSYQNYSRWQLNHQDSKIVYRQTDQVPPRAWAFQSYQ